MEDFASGSEKSIPSNGSSADSSSASTSNGTKLNPLAREWIPCRDGSPEQDRGLYLTFSQRAPVSEHEIIQFFNEKFGPCITGLYVNRRGENSSSHCAKVVFKSSHVPMVVMEDEEIAKFRVNSKDMWCKRYRTRTSKNEN